MARMLENIGAASINLQSELSDSRMRKLSLSKRALPIGQGLYLPDGEIMVFRPQVPQQPG